MEEQAQQEALRANLLRAISHDLRTPLTAISGNAGILMENASVLDAAKRPAALHLHLRRLHVAGQPGGEPALRLPH